MGRITVMIVSEPLRTSLRRALLRPAAIGVAGLVVAAAVAWVNFRPGAVALPPSAATAPAALPAPPAAHSAGLTPVPSPPTASPASAALPAPRFDIVRVAPDGNAVIAGRSAPGANITVTDNGKPIGHATADAQGQWVILPHAPMPAGGQELAARATRTDGAGAGSAPVLLLVPAVRSAAARSGPKPVQVPLAVAILAPPGAAPRLLAGPSGKTGLGMDIVDYDAKGRIHFAGTARPGATVRVYIDGAAAGDATADRQGRWALHPAAPVASGNHVLRLDQLTASGQVVARLELPFQRAALAAQEVPRGRIVVQPSQNLWRIARHAYGRGIDYMTIYQANLDQIRDPNLIYPGQVFAVPAIAPMPASSSTSR